MFDKGQKQSSTLSCDSSLFFLGNDRYRAINCIKFKKNIEAARKDKQIKIEKKSKVSECK